MCVCLPAICVQQQTNYSDEVTKPPNLHPQWQKINWRCCDVKQLVSVCDFGSTQPKGLFCVEVWLQVAFSQINKADGWIKRTWTMASAAAAGWPTWELNQPRATTEWCNWEKNKLFAALSVARETKLGRHKCAWTSLKWLLNTETTHLTLQSRWRRFHISFLEGKTRRLHVMRVRLRLFWRLYWAPALLWQAKRQTQP